MKLRLSAWVEAEPSEGFGNLNISSTYDLGHTEVDDLGHILHRVHLMCSQIGNLIGAPRFAAGADGIEDRARG